MTSERGLDFRRAAVRPRIRPRSDASSPDEFHAELVSISIVIVDDHEGFRAKARTLLSREGFVVLGEASDASSALSAVRVLRPDLLLVDVLMPGIDGFALVERLTQAFGDDPKAILISSRPDTAFRSRLSTTSALGFINKADLTGARVADLLDGTK